MTIAAPAYLRQFTLGLAHEVGLSAPEDLIDLGQHYEAAGDFESALNCVYLYTALRHPPPEWCPQTVELGREILETWLESRHWS